MTPLQQILHTYRQASQNPRQQGTYFEELIQIYLRFEATYADLYSSVWLFSHWAKAHPEFGISAMDLGIDLVAKTRGTEEFHAIQANSMTKNAVTKRILIAFLPHQGRNLLLTASLWLQLIIGATTLRHLYLINSRQLAKLTYTIWKTAK